MGLLMEQYMGLLWSACHLYLTNPEDIRECVQETFVDFYGNRERFRAERGTVKAYLYVIAKRKAIRMAAQNGKQSAVPLEMLEEAATEMLKNTGHEEISLSSLSSSDFSRLPESLRDADSQTIRSELTDIRDTAYDISSRMMRSLEQSKAPRQSEQER